MNTNSTNTISLNGVSFAPDAFKEYDNALREAGIIGKYEPTEVHIKMNMPEVDRIIFNNPATIVFWSDGVKTVVKAAENREFNPYYGFCAAVTKRLIGDNHNHAVKNLIERKGNIDLDAWDAQMESKIAELAALFQAVIDSEKRLREKYEPIPETEIIPDGSDSE